MPVTPDLIIKVGAEEHRFDPAKILNVEAIAIEKAAQLTWAQVMVGLNTGQLSAVTAVVWVLRKRTDPTLKFADVVFNVGEAEVIDPDSDARYAEPEVEAAEVPKDDESPADPN